MLPAGGCAGAQARLWKAAGWGEELAHLASERGDHRTGESSQAQQAPASAECQWAAAGAAGALPEDGAPPPQVLLSGLIPCLQSGGRDQITDLM